MTAAQQSKPTIAFLYHDSITVSPAVHFWVLLSKSQYIFQAIQCDLDDFAVHHSEQITQRRDTALFYQKPGEAKGIGKQYTNQDFINKGDKGGGGFLKCISELNQIYKR